MVVMLSEEESENWTLRLVQVLGGEKIGALSKRQAMHLNKAFHRLIDSKPLTDITDMEILVQYELTVNHTSPLVYEIIKSHK